MAAECNWANINNWFGANLGMQSYGLNHMNFFTKRWLCKVKVKQNNLRTVINL